MRTLRHPSHVRVSWIGSLLLFLLLPLPMALPLPVALRWAMVIALIGAEFAWIGWRSRFCRCPTCRRRLGATWENPVTLDAAGGTRLRFPCRACDTVWDTGLRGEGWSS